MRKALFPALREAYDCWLEDGSAKHFDEICERGKEHWLRLAQELQELFLKEGEIDRERFQAIIESRTL